MLKIVIASVLAVIVVSLQSALISAPYLLLGVGILLLLCLGLRRRQILPARSWRGCQPALLAFIVFYAWASLYGSHYMAVRHSLQGKQTWLVEIAELPQLRFSSGQVRLRLICRFLPDGQCEAASPLPVFAVASFPKDQFNEMRLLPGLRLRSDLEIIPLHAGYGSSFDSERWALTERIVAKAKLDLMEIESVGHHKTLGFWRAWLKQRLAFRSEVENSAFSGLSIVPLINALTLGDRSEMGRGHWQLLRETGTTHLMAISGLHLGIVGGWVYWLTFSIVGRLRFLNNRIYPQIPAAMVTVAAGLLYSLIVGFSLPTQRAFFMLLCAVVAASSNRPKMVINGLCFALLVILLIQPFAVLTASLWLSFAAVCIVFLIIAGRLSLVVGSSRPISMMLKIQWLLYLGMMPLSAYFFSGISLNSLLANLFAIPLVTLVLLPACFINALLALSKASWVPVVGEFNYWLMDSLLLLLQWVNGNVGGYWFLKLDFVKLALALTSMLLFLLPLNKTTRCLAVVLFIGVLAIKSEPVNPQVFLFDTPSPLLILRDQGGDTILDATAGLGFRERDLLRTQGVSFPLDQYWQRRWLQSGWQRAQLEINTQSFESACRLKNATSLRHFLATDDSCVLGMRWQGYDWLLAGKLAAEEQLALARVLGDEGRRFDFALLQGANISGALLNQLNKTNLILWHSEPADAPLLKRLRVRNIQLYQLAAQGDLKLTLAAKPTITPVNAKRFYHVTK